MTIRTALLAPPDCRRRGRRHRPRDVRHRSAADLRAAAHRVVEQRISVLPPSPGAPRLPVEQVLAAFARTHADAPSSVVVGADATDAVVVSAGPRTFYLDAYSGRVLGEGRQGMRQFMSDMRAWHRWLAYEDEARLTARAVTGWSNVAFLFIVVSGLYLWFPRRWTWQRAAGADVHRRRPRQGARLQLAQRDRRLVPGAALHRRGLRRADFVSLGQRPRLSRHGRGAAAAPRRRTGRSRARRRAWARRRGRSAKGRGGERAQGGGPQAGVGGLERAAGRAPSSRSPSGERSTCGFPSRRARPWSLPSIAVTAASRSCARR